MKHSLALAALLGAFVLTAAGTDSPRWLRNTSLSPDGSTVAFTYKGNIYTVPSAGGRATRITADGSYNTQPFFSPDGSRIAFSSNRNGGMDVFVAPAGGGTPVRLTTHSGGETVRGWLNDSTVVFSADIMPSREDLNGPFFIQTYTVGIRPGSRPVQLKSLDMRALDVNTAGDIIFQNRKSVENTFRKHEYSSGTPDVYLLRDGEFTRLTEGLGSSRNPVWLGQDGTRYAYTCDDSAGVLNVYEGAVGVAGRKKLTDFAEHPVRSLSASADGSLLAFSQDGEIYTLVPGQQPKKVEVEILTDDYDADRVARIVSSGADNMAVSPEGDEVAFTLRGDVYTTAVKYETTRRITDTPGQERSISFAPDGRSMVFDGERDSTWCLYLVKLDSEDDKNFTYSSGFTEEVLYRSDKAAQQPVFSPDGKKVAFLEDRATLRVLDLESRQATTALDGRFNYSYSDGDITFEWSPDSRWLLIDYIGNGGWNNKDIALVKADGSEVVDLTESGYDDSDPHWVLGGKAITYTTGRYGMRSHGSWGNQDDVVFMALDPEAWDTIRMTKEEAELAEAAEEEAEEEEAEETSSSKNKKNKNQPEEPADSFDLRNRHFRKMRLTDVSVSMGDHFLSPKGDKLYYLALSPDADAKLYVHDLRADETSVLAEGINGGFVPDKDGENLFILTGDGMYKLDLSDGESKSIDFEAPYDRRPSLEREYIYDHALRQVKDKFYDPDLHGVAWDSIGAHYREFLPYISNTTDFAELLSEVLGELNASHTGSGASGTAPRLRTATLGAFFDPAYEGDGLKILELLPRSPLGTRKAGVEAGDIILAIDGQSILAGKDYFPLLEGKAGRNTELRVRKADGTEKTVKVKPLSSDVSLQYQAWIERNEQLVDSLSGGRIAYVHVEGMDSPSFRSTYERLLGKYRNCEAAIVDTRFNGGGWLHNDLAQLLSGRQYATFEPRGQYIGSEPFSQWTKPSVMLVNEANYSDAYGTPFTYQALGIGDLVGAPVPGTMTAVWWETQIDPDIYFGIPQVTIKDMQGKVLENHQLQPEVEVYNTPAETTSGNDLQLRTAVSHLLEKLDADR